MPDARATAKISVVVWRYCSIILIVQLYTSLIVLVSNLASNIYIYPLAYMDHEIKYSFSNMTGVTTTLTDARRSAVISYLYIVDHFFPWNNPASVFFWLHYVVKVVQHVT